jgi:hypothetical protein
VLTWPTAEVWNAIGAAGTAGGSLIAALAFVGAVYGLWQNTRALKWQVLEGVFRDIRELDRQYIADFERMTPTQKNAWSATFFNTVEYLCFIVHHKLAPAGVLKRFFFDQALPDWRRMFDEHVANGILGDSEAQFSEFKRATAQRAGAM